MKYCWVLPAFFHIPIAIAAQRAFSVGDDLLAYPQYKVEWLEDYVTDIYAEQKLHRDTASSESHVERYNAHDGRLSEAPVSAEVSSDYGYELMMLHGQRFLCAIPQIALSDADEDLASNDTTRAQQREEEASELARASERGWELLSAMQGNCVYYVSGWWSYSFCFNQGVRQFHALPPNRGMPIYPPQEDTGVKGFMLGTYDEDELAQKDSAVSENVNTKKLTQHGELVTKGETRYLVQNLDGGTICDLTGKGRRIEVQFHCNPNAGIDRISLIKELSTCAYLMVIQTPRLCNDVAFIPPKADVPNSIQCKPILRHNEIDEYVEELAALKEAQQKSEEWITEIVNSEQLAEAGVAQLNGIQIVGDVIVGGHNIVPDDTELEKSAIVGGGKETFIETVASSGGPTISKEDMDRLGYGDLKAVEKLKKEMESRAEGRNWKLDIVDTPRGREYRGYIDEKSEKIATAEKDEAEDGSEEEFKEDL